MFYRYSCGCIATAPGDYIIIVKFCDDDSSEMHFQSASLARKTQLNTKECVPLSDSEEKELVLELGTLVSQGYSFRAIKNLLKG